jgi:hypothetical protein
MRLAIAALLAAAACGDNLNPFEGLVPISPATSPYAAGCARNVDPQGTLYPSEEVEPWLAADAADPDHLVAVWQQDRWSDGGANGTGAAVSRDGGATWRRTRPRFTTCDGGPYQRASDPWVAITPGGIAWAASIAFDASSPRSGVEAARSPDGGLAWEAPYQLIADDDPDVLNDKDAITADPANDNLYVVWDRLTGLTEPTQPIGTGPAMLARWTHGAWEAARPIYDPGLDAQTLGNVIVVLGDGTLVDVFDLITKISTANATAIAAAIRSTDHGDTWSGPMPIAPLGGIGISGVRTGAGLVQVAASGQTIYATWEDRANDHEAIVLSISPDGGSSWSTPRPINGAPDVDAFAPTVAVAPDGTIAVFYYDLRGTVDGRLHATPWLATSRDGGATFHERALAASFPLAPAKLGNATFLGDYEGLAAAGGRFVPAVAVAVSEHDPTDIFVPDP